MKKASGIVITMLFVTLLLWVAFNKKLPNAISNFQTGKTLKRGTNFRGVGSSSSW